MADNGERFLREVLDDPRWLFYRFDLFSGSAGFVRVDDSTYRRAAFLDQRLPVSRPEQRVVSLKMLQGVYDQAARQSRPGHFIFHLGHCGSTLLSRLLGEFNGVHSLREPLPLGELSMLYRERGTRLAYLNSQQYDHLEKLVLHLLKRVFAPEQLPIIKATSICTNLAERALGDHPETRLVLVYVDLETFLAGMLRNRARCEEINANSRTRLQDLNRALESDALSLHELDQVQRTVVAWASGMMTFDKLLTSATRSRCLLIDFQQFLSDPAGKLQGIVDHLGLAAGPDSIRTLLDGPLMRTYAKDTKMAFTAEDRLQQLTQARLERREDIRAGGKWLNERMRCYPPLQTVAKYIG